jgi:hypothetical protein
LKEYLAQELQPFTKNISEENRPKADLRQVLQLLTSKIAMKHKSHHQLYSVVESGQENEDDNGHTNIYQPSKRRQLLSLNEQQLPKKDDLWLANKSSERISENGARKLKVRIKNKTNSGEVQSLRDKENDPLRNNHGHLVYGSRQYLNLGVTFAELLKGKSQETSVGSVGSQISSPLLLKSNQGLRTTGVKAKFFAPFTEQKDHSRSSGSPITRGGPIKVARLVKNGSPRHIALSSGYSSFDNYFENQSKMS